MPGARPHLRRAAGALFLLCALYLALHTRKQIGQNWSFAGADTFNYIAGASELRGAGRYAMPPPTFYPLTERRRPVPPAYGRPPGYSAFLALVARPEHPEPDYERIGTAAKDAQHVVDLLTCALVFFVAHTLAGPIAAAVAVTFAALSPFLWLYANSILTECLSTLLTTLAVALWVFALRPQVPPRRAGVLFFLGGLAAGLNMLVRIDGVFLLPCLLAPLVLVRARPAPDTETDTAASTATDTTPAAARRDLTGLRLCALALAGFLLAYGPWLARNYARFGQLHALGGQTDVAGREMRHTAFFLWFATWVVDEEQTPDTLYCFTKPRCVSLLDSYPPEAFDSPAERAEVGRLFTLRARNHNAYTPEIDAGSRRLALSRLRRHPIRTLIVLPLQRALHTWTSANDRPLQGTDVLPWPQVMERVVPRLPGLSIATLLGGLIGILCLALLPRYRGARPAAALLTLVVLVRTAALALIGFTDSRYLIELHPILYALGGVLLAALCAEVAEVTGLSRAARSRARSG